MTYDILPIRAEHIDSFHAALDRVARERKYLAMLEAPPLETFRAFVLNNIRYAIFPQVVAVSGNSVVGWCDVMIVSDRPVHAHAGFITIGIVAEHRGRGLGARLIEAAVDAARAKGLTRLELIVREENAAAVALYKKMGFAIEGLKRNANRVDGVYENAYVMGLLLDPAAA
jgi:ribosomal protein S18 acetylase RimI-like enzyme